MCGVCGVHGPKASVGAVVAMLDRMAHRGPDGADTWEAPGIALGHRRLAIVDLSERGRQPMLDGRVVISVNGEIYNYRELRRELEAEGCVFRSDCDSETVIHAWRRWGEAGFARYNGMFAIALWDIETRALYLVRDRMGIKPLYYWRNGRETLFASDLRAVVAASGRREWPISATGLAQYLAYENRFGGETMLDGVRMVEPGHFVRIDDTGLSDAVFADPLAGGSAGTDFQSAVAEFPVRFGAAIDRHLMSDVPLASYLSAGVDSGLVTVAAADRLGGAGLTAFTGAFDAGGWYDEASGAAMVAASRKLEHKLVRIDAESFRAHFDDFVFALEEPRMGTGALPQYLVARGVAETHKVVLTGHGGDELFAGYPVFKFAVLARSLARRDLVGAWRTLSSLRISELPHIAYFALSALLGRREKFFLPRLFGAGIRRRLLRGRVERALGPAAPIEDSPSDPYEALMAQYLKDYLPGLLVVEDKVSMAHALESRTPFLDNDLVEWALSLPIAAKLDGGRLKAVPRAAARGVLPEAIFRLPKRGFPNPLGRWLRGPLADWAAERLHGPKSALGLLFDPAEIKRHVVSYGNSPLRKIRPLDEISTHRIWMLLCLESWIRQFDSRLGVRLTPPGGEGASGG